MALSFLSVSETDNAAILPMRELYRLDMDCQIIHDSLHPRPGWTQPYLLHVDDRIAGYGAIVLGGPWKGSRTIFEYFVLPEFRRHVFALFEVFMKSSAATGITVQSNDPHLTVMLHVYAQEISSESILFHDRATTHHALPIEGLIINKIQQWEWEWELHGVTAAKGGVLFHYNPPYGDIFMEVLEPFRRQGLGAYVVQEFKRACHEQGIKPTARCNIGNIPSRKTLQKAGFVPCGHMLNGALAG